MDDFGARLELLYQKAYEYRSIVDDPQVAPSAKQVAKMDLDGLFYRLAEKAIHNSEAESMKRVRMAKPKGDTISEMRDYIRGTPLDRLGDAVLMWVNDGDVSIGQMMGSVDVLSNKKEADQ